MNIEVINGYTIALDRMPADSNIVISTFTEDLLFEEEMIHRGFGIIGIDSNLDRLAKAYSLQAQSIRSARKLHIVRRLLTPTFEIAKPMFVDEYGKDISTMSNHVGVNAERFVLYPTVGLFSLLSKLGNVSLLVLNVNGEEYKLAKSLDPKCQVFIRFHQKALGYCDVQTNRLIDGMKKRGYTVASIAPCNGRIDVLFLLA